MFIYRVDILQDGILIFFLILWQVSEEHLFLYPKKRLFCLNSLVIVLFSLFWFVSILASLTRRNKMKAKNSQETMNLGVLFHGVSGELYTKGP